MLGRAEDQARQAAGLKARVSGAVPTPWLQRSQGRGQGRTAVDPEDRRGVGENLRGSARPTRQSVEAIRRDSLRRRSLAVTDLCTLALAYAAVTATLSPAGLFADERLPLLAALPLWVLLNKLLGLYEADANLVHKSTLNEVPRIVQSILLGTGCAFLLAPLVGVPLSRTSTIAFIGLATALNLTLRYGVRQLLRRNLSVERCLIVGSGQVAEVVARKVESHPEYGATVIGLADVPAGSDQVQGNGRRWETAFTLERPTDLGEICRDNAVDRVILAYSRFSPEEELEAIQTSKLLGMKISVVPRLVEITGASVEIDEIEGVTLLGLRGFTRTRSSLLLKRAIDVMVAAVALTVLLPALVAVAAAIKLNSPGPILYAQARIGRGSQPFRLLKFRTMVDGAEAMKPELEHLNEASPPMFKLTDDPRVTPVGRFLRRTSLDELPQLWNVLKGEMSLVGPRPLVPSEDGQVVGWHRQRLNLTPGLTGPWQVLGRTAIPFTEMVHLDYLYVAEWSLWNDIKLLLRTAPVVLTARGQ